MVGTLDAVVAEHRAGERIQGPGMNSAIEKGGAPGGYDELAISDKNRAVHGPGRLHARPGPDVPLLRGGQE